jgi:2-polyprenyl-6-hydroxyphenyl methylase/3-demethylubiquinone-9 3-methyltransferase
MSSGSYYRDTLAAHRLERCYELATHAVRRYLEAEITFLLDRLDRGDSVLELGCGYGRVLGRLAPAAGLAVGVDTSLSSLVLARTRLHGQENTRLLHMDATSLGLRSATFDMVCCIQNGVSAFHVDQRRLLESALRVARPGGLVLFSSYAPGLWEDRLEWFRIQASHGLIGEIDDAATGDGVIVCNDGFTATTVSLEDFETLARGLGRRVEVKVVDGSSVFCEITV